MPKDRQSSSQDTAMKPTWRRVPCSISEQSTITAVSSRLLKADEAFSLVYSVSSLKLLERIALPLKEQER